ncbi:MAG: hypothetical protein ACOH12_13160 [Parvibaculaceae bacterium]
MVTFPVASLRWSLERGRCLGAAVAFVLAVGLRIETQSNTGILQALAIVLPALEVAMFALVLAFYFDSEAEDQALTVANNTLAHNAEALVAWFVVIFALMWGNIVMVQMAINAYVTLGVPPVWAAQL